MQNLFVNLFTSIFSLVSLLLFFLFFQVYCTHTAPDYSLPWQKQRQYTSTGRHVLISSPIHWSWKLLGFIFFKNDFGGCQEKFYETFSFSILVLLFPRLLFIGACPCISPCSAFMIGDGKLLTNAHCVEHNTQVYFIVVPVILITWIQ